MQIEIPIDMISAEADGSVESVNGQLTVNSGTDTTTYTGSFDDVQGVLTITIPKIGTLQITGFPTTTGVGQGTKGDAGVAGRDGVDGTLGADGQRGADGCIGPQGSRGDAGKTGARGQQGQQGELGPTGATGATGATGVMQIYMQADMPEGSEILPGAIWVKL